MNNKFIIVAESSCDLDNEYCQKNDVEIAAFNFSLGDMSYRHYFDEREMTYKEFYMIASRGGEFKSNLVNVEQHTESMEKHLKAGYDILGIGFSSNLSGSFNCMRIASDLLSEKYPQRKIIIIDTLAATMGQGILVCEAVKQKKKNKTIEETADFIKKNAKYANHHIWIDNLKFLAKGGRFGTDDGGIPSFKPILAINKSGKLELYKKLNSREEAIIALVNELEICKFNPAMEVAIAHANNEEGAYLLKQAVLKKYPGLEIRITWIGPLIGLHVGPGTIGLFFFGNERFGS